MNCRSDNKHLKIIGKSPGEEHKKIGGAKLPTFEQVLLCYLSNIKELRNMDKTKNKKLVNNALQIVATEVSSHYKKAGIKTKTLITIKKDIAKLNQEYVNISKKKDEQRIKKFREKLQKTMNFWRKDVLQNMIHKTTRPRLNEVEKKAFEQDIEFLKNMMTTRTATYMSKDESCTEQN